MKIACIQLSSGENYQNNFKDILKYVNQAIKNKSDLIITPETSSLMSSSRETLFKYSFKMNKDPILKKIKEVSKKYKKWILLGSICVKVKNKLRNRSILVGPDGKIVKYYDKINMFDVKIPNKEQHKESKTFKAGNKLVTANLPWGKIGFTICFDLRFPELYRNLSKKNLSFIAVPSAFTKFTGQKHWLALLRARAIENFCYIFAPAQTGKNTSKRETFGHTAIISPDGKILALKKSGKGVVYSNIKPRLAMNLRKIIPSML